MQIIILDVTTSAKYGHVLAFGVPIAPVKFFEVDVVGLILVIVMERPP